MLLEYQQTVTLRPNDFDCEDNVKISSLLDLFQMVASRHAELLGAGYEAMKNKNTIWVLSKIRLDALKPIPFGATVTIVTHPLPKGRVDYLRDYLVKDEEGEILATGSSQWVLVDLTSRRIARPFVDFEGEYALPIYNDRLTAPPTASNPPSHIHTVVFPDMDHNGHVNNSKYADMIYEGKRIERAVKKFEIAFVKETKIGEEIAVFYQEEENALLASGKTNDAICFTAKLTF